MNIDKQIDDIVLELAHEGSMIQGGKTINASMFPEAKAKIQSLITKAELEAAQQATKANNDLHRLHERNIDEVVTKARIDQIDELIDIQEKQFNRWTQKDIANYFERVGVIYRELKSTLPVDELLEGEK